MRRPGQVATLILPGDTAWNEGAGPAKVAAAPERARVSEDAVEGGRERAARREHRAPAHRPALREKGLELAGRIAAKTGARMLAQTFNRRMERGAGRVAIERIPYPVDQASKHWRDAAHRARGQPRRRSRSSPIRTSRACLRRKERSSPRWPAEEDRRTRSNGSPTGRRGAQPIEPSRYDPPKPASGKIDTPTLAQSLGSLIPENAIVVDEGVSTGRGFFPHAQRAPAHLAAEHGRLDRHRHADGDRRRDRVPGPQGL